MHTSPNLAPQPHKLAYLVSQYPATSHTFILREVLSLGEQGFVIHPASINEDLRPLTSITTQERAERERTYYVKNHGFSGAIAGHAWAIANNPRGYLRGLAASLRRCLVEPRRTPTHLFHFTEALMLGRWMAATGLNRLHVHFATAAASVASLVKATFPIHLSMTVHGPDEFNNVRTEHFAEKIARADQVICISQFARSQSMQHSAPAHWHKLSVVRLGVDAAQFSPAATSPPRPGLSRPDFSLLCVGRLTPAKGQHLILDALATLREQSIMVSLTLVGDGPDRASLESHCIGLGLREQVRFTGALNQDEVRPLYHTHDAFILPSFAEGIPVVLMEAMASGLPCITTRIAGIPELIEHEHSGLLTFASDVTGLCESIQRLAQNDSLRLRLAANGRNKVCTEYNLESNIRKLADIFRAKETA